MKYEQMSKGLESLLNHWAKENPDRVPVVDTQWGGLTMTITLRDGGPAPREWMVMLNGVFLKKGGKAFTPYPSEAELLTRGEALGFWKGSRAVHVSEYKI